MAGRGRPRKKELQEEQFIEDIKEGVIPDIPKGLSEEALLEQVFDRTITQEDIDKEAQSREAQDIHGSKELFNDRHIELKTELLPVEIVAITQIRFMADRYDIPAFRVFTDDMMKLKVSNRRQGRREFIQGLHAEEKRVQGEKGGTPLDWLMGKIGLGGNQQ